MFAKKAISQTTWIKYLRWSRIQVSKGFCYQSKQRTAPRVFKSTVITAFILLASSWNEQSTADDLLIPHICAPDNERENFESFLSCLKEVVQSEDIEIDEDECRQRGKPWNSYHKVSSYPRIIISPTTTAQVQLHSARFWLSSCTSSHRSWCTVIHQFYKDHSVNDLTFCVALGEWGDEAVH